LKVESFAWHFPQKSRLVGFDGLMTLGETRCWGGVVWHEVHFSWTWWETESVLAISPWHAEHSLGTVGGFGSCGSWQVKQGFIGLWATGLIMGYPLGREGLKVWHTGQNFRSRGAGGFTFSGSSVCAFAGPWQVSHERSR
jgi:hypothetical protein